MQQTSARAASNYRMHAAFNVFKVSVFVYVGMAKFLHRRRPPDHKCQNDNWLPLISRSTRLTGRTLIRQGMAVPMTPSASISTDHRPLASFNTPASMSTTAQHACLLQPTADDAGSPVYFGSALQALDAHTRAGSETACRGRDWGWGSRHSSCKDMLVRQRR